MSAPMYFAMGGAIWVREHQPVTLQRASLIESIHRMNAAYQLIQTDERTLARRLEIAQVETALADEMATAIREASQPKDIAA